jgi:anaphase-promoting complex subunit 3
LALLGDIFRKSNRTQRAIQYYQMSLQLDPFLWSSFQALTDLGVTVDVPTVFGVSQTTTAAAATKTPLQPPSPGLTPIHQNTTTTMEEETPSHTTVVLRRARQVANRGYYPPSPETPSLSTVTRSMRYLQGLGEAEPRSLFLEDEKGDVQTILQTLATMGQAYQELSHYQCQACLDTFKQLPLSHQNTSWVLHQQGKAYLELNEFTAAQRCLEHMKHLEPGRLEGLELLSTVYWHQKKEVDLASLAQHVVAWDKRSPQAWCVVGNCFSLQKDHEAALSFFKRSLQLDPDFTYTHTLCGYEYMANEDFEPAMACFRQAIRTNERHYNAWYGLGCIYHRQEKYDLAEYHFERACQIHPTSSILRCNWGISQHANGKAYQALETLSEASRLDPGNPQARFQRATIYSALHRPQEAALELEKVRDAAPREATVHFCLGKVYKRLGRLDDAMKCFLAAMDLDPKDSQTIKSAMDKLDNPDIDEETMIPF